MEHNYLGKREWMNIMLVADGKNISEISHDTELTYSHVLNTCDAIVSMGWLSRTKEGRTVIFSLTPLGVKVKDAVLLINNELKRKENNGTNNN